MSIIHQPRPEERAAQTSLRSLRKLDCGASVSKDGRKRDRASLHPSRRRYAPPQRLTEKAKKARKGQKKRVIPVRL